MHDVRTKCATFLRSRLLHVVFLGLVVVDFACVVGELSLTLVMHSTCGEDRASSQHIDAASAVAEVLGHISLGIVSLFLLEAVAKLVFLGWTHYCHDWLHLFDAAIICATFTMSVVLHGREEREVAGLLIVFRVGYIFRIIDSVALTSELVYQDTIHRLELEIAELRLQVEHSPLVAWHAPPSQSKATQHFAETQ